MADLTQSIPRSVWWGWGDPREARPLSETAWRSIKDRLGVTPLSSPERPIEPEQILLPDSRLTDAARDALVEAVGADQVREDRQSRIERAGGKSYPDLRRLRSGDGSQAPDAVVLPGDAEQVAALVAACVKHRVAVVPFGGGTSVVGGVGADRGTCDAVVSMDLRRMDRMTHIDPVSKIATFEPGMRGPDVERSLHPHGLTLGHYPQSHQEATIGGYVATRSAGQASTGYGRVDEHVIGVRLVTPTGELALGGRSPASAAGPRLLDLVVGSEGALGVITEVTLGLSALPTAKRHACWAFPSFHEGAAALRAMAQDLGHGLIADVCRLSDEEESFVTLAMAGRSGSALSAYAGLRRRHTPCIAILVWEGGDDGQLAHRQRLCEKVIRDHGAIQLPSMIARHWEHTRFKGPYMRDELMSHRILADTLETATTWENLPRLHGAVAAAIHRELDTADHQAIVMCHISHVYAAGASLYYTFIASEEADPVAQWQRVKSAASQAITGHGGTITHHHSVGRDHRPYLGRELGEVGARVLRAVKTELDPSGILNPGKLIPTEHECG